MYNGGLHIYHEYACMRLEEMMAAAKNIRLLNLATQNKENASIQCYRLSQWALLELGQLLVTWGTYLQEHYNRNNETPAFAAYLERGAYEK